MEELNQGINEPLENTLKVAKEYLIAISQWIIDFVTVIQEGFENKTEGFHFTQTQFLFLIGMVAIVCFLIAKRHRKQEIKQETHNTVNTVQLPSNRTKRITGKTWYPTGWTYNEKTRLWEPPDYLIAESYERWVWDEEKGIWIDLYRKKKK